MTYEALELIWNFDADWRTDRQTDRRTKVFQEVIADLKMRLPSVFVPALLNQLVCSIVTCVKGGEGLLFTVCTDPETKTGHVKIGRAK